MKDRSICILYHINIYKGKPAFFRISIKLCRDFAMNDDEGRAGWNKYIREQKTKTYVFSNCSEAGAYGHNKKIGRCL